ncbi:MULTISPECIES: DegV family protein [Lactococcus]|uniref:DegV family protein in cluster with TrmH family tRNA/rRNA methyltransferase YacO n=1 Tax=Lactococcus lactis subsp. cremoris TaxID=1359 RepID=A0A166J4R8_LACLC|nr:DegV family protein [Lactococcus cremoris]KZK05516.1 DegV family protein in cluster with TrmH family tRNA/rRNA methyltransferase YacO [Lactococcus cremoris]
MTFQIMTDSTSDLSQYYLKKNHIEILGMTVTVGNQIYETIGEEALDNSTLLSAIKKGATVHTSQINSGQFLEVFKKYALAEEELLYLAFSSGLSGTYQSALIAQNMILEEFPNAKITVIDTLAAASGEGFIVEETVKLRDAGKSLTETLTVLSDIIPRLQSRFMVDDLNHLARGGRIPKAVALVGTMANIKPLLDVDPAGKLRQVTKVRGKKKAINQMLEKTLEEMDTAYPRLVISYSGTDEVAQEIKKQAMQKNGISDVDVRPLSPTIVTHTGDGTIAIFSISRQSRE